MSYRLVILLVLGISTVLFFFRSSITFCVVAPKDEGALPEALIVQPGAWIDVRVLGRGSPATIGPRTAVAEPPRVGELHAVRPQRHAVHVGCRYGICMSMCM